MPLDLAPAANRMADLRPIQFEDLLGSGTINSSRFTCSFDTGEPLSNYTKRATKWEHATPSRQQKERATLEVGIGLGMMTRHLELHGTRIASTDEMLLSAARKTWMAEPLSAHLELIILMSDCANRPASTDVTTACAEPNATWMHHAASTMRLHKVHWRCYWGDSGQQRVHHKLSILLRDLLTVLGRKRYYAKIETDTLLIPQNLLRFLTFLDENVGPDDVPLYFGSDVFRLHRPGASKRASQPAAIEQLGPGCRSEAERRQALHDDRCVTRTAAWDALVAREAWDADQARIARATEQITFAQGAFEGFSYSALRAVALDGCVQKVGNLPCVPAAQNGRAPIKGQHCGLHSTEDASLGLCMHLKQIRLLDCAAFVGILPACWWVRMYGCAEDTPYSRVPRYPISIHTRATTKSTIDKSQDAYLKWWSVIKGRDATLHGPELTSWQSGSDRWQPRVAHGRGRAKRNRERTHVGA